MARVSILMNCFNGARTLKEALDSVVAQTYADWEVIFIDNQSTDGSGEIAASYGPRVKIVQTPRKMTLCEGRVFSQPYVQGEFLAVLDVDDLWFPEKLARQVQIMDENPDVGLVYSNTMYFSDRDGDVKAAYVETMPSGDVFRAILRNYFISLETVLVRRSVMDRHGLYFSPRYNVSSDLELFVKLAFHTRFQYIDAVLAKWRFGHGNESVHQFMSFPREYEQLLVDLDEMIPDFEKRYASEIQHLRGVIENMYGIGNWKKGDRRQALEHFSKAKGYNRKYWLPYLLSRWLPYSVYGKFREKIGKI